LGCSWYYTHVPLTLVPLPTPYPLSSLLQCSREYWGTNPAGVREISRACALEDEARAAVASAVPPELQARLEELVAQGGPAPAPPSELGPVGGAQECGVLLNWLCVQPGYGCMPSCTPC
jgi:hypothetical protein